MARTIDAGADGGVDDETKDRIIADFRRVMGDLRCIASERLVRLGVSMTQLHVMSMLERHGDMPMSRLADVVDVSLSNATGLVDRMEERGFVERVRVPDDRRIVLVRLTGTGRGLLEDLEGLRAEMLRELLDHLDPAQLQGLARATSDVRDALGAMVTDPRGPDQDHPNDRLRA